MNELSQLLHHRITKELAGSHVIHLKCSLNAGSLEQPAIAIPGFVYAVRVKKESVAWVFIVRRDTIRAIAERR